MDSFLKNILPDDSPSCSPMTPVHTLAFIDLETTGLGFDVGRRNVHITELAIVAVDRHHFENDLKLRVMHKINIFIKPRAPISYSASSITGLYDDMLEFQKPFDSSVAEILTVFFSRLRSPICLIAHNGNRFDFPLLQAEFKRLGLSLHTDITCADTLQGFRTFGLPLPTNPIPTHHLSSSSDEDEIELKEATTEIKRFQHLDAAKNYATLAGMNDLSSDEVDNILSQNIEEFQKIDPSVYYTQDSSNNQINNQNFSKNGHPSFLKFSKQMGATAGNSTLNSGDKTPQNNEVEILNQGIEVFKKINPSVYCNFSNNQNYSIKNGESSIVKLPEQTKIAVSNDTVTFGDKTPETNVIKPTETSTLFCVKKKSDGKPNHFSHDSKKMSHVKRKLFDSVEETHKVLKCGEASNVTTVKKNSFKNNGLSLEKIYIHYFGQKPIGGHQAEIDCINLCKVCQKIRDTFLPWLDENQRLFSEIVSMW